MENRQSVLSLIVVAALLLTTIPLTIHLKAKAQSWNPFELIIKKSEDQRKAQIYRVITDLETELREMKTLYPLPFTVEKLTDLIYEKEQLK